MPEYIRENNNFYSSINDTNNYTLKKLDNGLQILFIEDKKALTSTANMYVNVGSVDNPNDTQGLAHFLEHMLFMGSSKYPDVAHFKNFITTHGGYTNAYTAHTFTYYYFSVTNKILEGLDIFSNFFIDPLFNKKYVEKEVNAVCSEHNKNISSDGWRGYSLIKKFFDDSHNNTFGCGNKETLFNDNDTDKLIKKLREFFNDFYNPDKMILIVSHKKIDDKFIDKTVSMFKKISNKKTKTTNYEPKITYYDDKYEIIKMKAIKKEPSIVFNWFVKGDQHYKKNKSFIFGLLRYILGSASVNSLDNILSNSGLIKFLHISTDEVYLTHTHVRIDIELTEKGLNHYNAIIIMVCTYLKNLNMSKDFINEFYEEFKKKKLMDFITQIELDSSSLADSIITQYNLTRCPLSEILIQSIKFDNIDLDYFFDIISQMTQNKMKIVLVSDTFDIKELSLIDKYYGTHYNKEFLPLKDEEKIKNIYPELNKYLTDKFEIITPIKKKSKHYLKLKSSNKNIYYLKKSNNFNTYFNIFICHIRLDEMYVKNVEYYTDLLIHLAYIQKLHENLFYDLSVSKNDISIDINDDVLRVSFKSIDNKNIPKLLKQVLDLYFNKNETKINQTIYKTIVDELIDNINNYYLSQSYELLNSEFRLLLNPEFNYSNQEILKCIKKDLTHEKSFNLTGQITGLFGGSITLDNVQKIIDIVDDKFEQSKIIYEEYCLKEIAKTITIKSKNKENTENAICYGVNLMKYTDDLLLLKSFIILLETYIHEKFFNIVRTEKQVGYIVQAKVYNVKTLLYPEYYLCFIVQSSLDNLKEIIKDFIDNNYMELFDKLSDEEFKEITKGISKSLKEKKTNIGDEIIDKINILETNEKFHKKEKFDMYKKISQIIKKMSKKDFVDFGTSIIKNPVAIVQIQKI
uniref:Uncharacterized protein n=1 Tax=viral metagenome TaxID=1070528 RepID=A0A6C0DZ65_9ZZZZ